jgi:hypothetical protein
MSAIEEKVVSDGPNGTFYKDSTQLQSAAVQIRTIHRRGRPVVNLDRLRDEMICVRLV